MAEREYDVVLFGATGFTGALTAEYLARTRAGRNARGAGRAQHAEARGRARAVSAAVDPARRAAAAPSGRQRRRLAADVAESTKVVITTVGPYINYGEPLVAACAAAGTHYVDLTGEPEFVDLMWLRHHEQPSAAGAKIVHSCGFDSIPYDLGCAVHRAAAARERVPIKLEGFVRVGGTFSGGTYHSALRSWDGWARASASPASAASRNPSRPARKVKGVPGAPAPRRRGGGWVVPFPTIDPQTVLRSARALERYGPDFTYSHYLVVKRLPVSGRDGHGSGISGRAGPVPARAQGADEAQELRARAHRRSSEPRAGSRSGWSARADGSRVVTEVSGGDPGYTETSKMLAESALCLAHDELPDSSGQLTPAVAMGQPLIDRLPAGRHRVPNRGARDEADAGRSHARRQRGLRTPPGLPRAARARAPC